MVSSSHPRLSVFSPPERSPPDLTPPHPAPPAAAPPLPVTRLNVPPPRRSPLSFPPLPANSPTSQQVGKPTSRKVGKLAPPTNGRGRAAYQSPSAAKPPHLLQLSNPSLLPRGKLPLLVRPRLPLPICSPPTLCSTTRECPLQLSRSPLTLRVNRSAPPATLTRPRSPSFLTTTGGGGKPITPPSSLAPPLRARLLDPLPRSAAKPPTLYPPPCARTSSLLPRR